MEQLLDESGVYRVLQTINHIKVVLNGGTTTAKAYAGTILLRSV
jgi:hypothetical protein